MVMAMENLLAGLVNNNTDNKQFELDDAGFGATEESLKHCLTRYQEESGKLAQRLLELQQCKDCGEYRQNFDRLLDEIAAQEGIGLSTSNHHNGQ